MAHKVELESTRMNLGVIKRVDPYAKDIVDTSAHVAFYTFNSDDNEWEKTDVEGAFFIYSRNAEPFHSIFINNRLNTNSFVEPITSQLELQAQPPFLLYRNERSRVRGFWFYSSSECDRISELVGRLIKECEAKVTVSKTEMLRPAGNNVDIFSMLSKAQQDFNNAQSGGGNSIGGGGGPIRPNNLGPVPMGLILQTQSQQPQAPPLPNQLDVSVLNFFAAAKPAAASEVPLFQRLLSNPVSVDQIEKQQRATTPQEIVGRLSPPVQQLHNVASQPNTAAASISSIENGMGFMGLHSPMQQQQSIDLGTSPLAKFIGSSNVGGLVGNARNTTSQQLLANAPSSSDLEASHQKQPILQLLKKEINVAPPFYQSPLSAKPALMPPTMFQSTSAGKGHAAGGVQKDSSSNQPLQSTPQQPQSHLLTRQSHEQQAELGQSQQLSAPVLSKPEPLTETQLVQAMSYLIKNDPEFIKKLHEAYLKSFTEMVSL